MTIVRYRVGTDRNIEEATYTCETEYGPSYAAEMYVRSEWDKTWSDLFDVYVFNEDAGEVTMHKAMVVFELQVTVRRGVPVGT